MSEIIAKAKEVAESLVESKQFERLQQTEKRVESDETASAMLAELEAKYEKLSQSSGNGRVSRELQQEVQATQKKMLENEKIKEYFQAQQQFNQLMQQVNQEISSALGTQQQSGCAPNSGCC